MFSAGIAFGGEDAPEPPQLTVDFELDGFRLIKALHGHNSLGLLRNGARGPGLTLSFFGRMSGNAFRAANLHIETVSLADGIDLPKEKIRPDWGTSLSSGDDCVAISVELDIVGLPNFKLISGHFTAEVPVGLTKTTIEEIVDNVNYHRVNVPDASRIVTLRVLDADGKELKQSMPFHRDKDVVGVYARPKENEPLVLELEIAERFVEQKIPFAIENVKLIEE